MPQILVDPQKITSQHFSISGPEAHHLIRVLRKKNNDLIDFFDGAGRQYRGQITMIDLQKLEIKGKVLESKSALPAQAPVHLFQGLPKGSKIDYVIEKATELGASAVIPFLSQKNVIKVEGQKGKTKVERWNNLARAAAKQSGQLTLPSIGEPGPLKSFEKEFRGRTTLVFDTGENTLSLKSVLKELPKDLKAINFVIGPESGWAPDELKWLVSLGAKIVSLGEFTLRTETAGLAALAAWNYENH